jgi:glycopeptide antibiotics resistance protein
MWWILCSAWSVVILAATVLPFKNFVGHAHWDQIRWIPFYSHPVAPLDVVANVALFIPFGFLLRRALAGRSRKQAWIVTLLLAAVISTGVEFYQVFCHNRVPSSADICTNLLGAILGVVWSETR